MGWPLKQTWRIIDHSSYLYTLEIKDIIKPQNVKSDFLKIRTQKDIYCQLAKSTAVNKRPLVKTNSFSGIMLEQIKILPIYENPTKKHGAADGEYISGRDGGFPIDQKTKDHTSRDQRICGENGVSNALTLCLANLI